MERGTISINTARARITASLSTYSVFDHCPRVLKVEARASLRSVTPCAGSLDIGDTTVALSRFRCVAAAWAVTLLALNVLEQSWLRFLIHASLPGSGCMAVQTPHLELEWSRGKRIGRVSVRA